jgi:Uma2 family endonuclease
MATVRSRLKLSPLDHGRRLSLAAFDAADYVPGFQYEIIDGKVYVSPQPNPPESILEWWLRRAVERYSDAHPDVINFVAVKGRVFLPRAVRPTVPEPDLAAYAAFPLDSPYGDIRWERVSPVLVCEVLVGGDIHKDLTRNPTLYHRVPSIKEYWVLNGSEDPNEPSLIQHRRRGKAWTVNTYPYGSTFTTKLLPGFTLVIDPRK